jgi:hypothetical protein
MQMDKIHDLARQVADCLEGWHYPHQEGDRRYAEIHLVGHAEPWPLPVTRGLRLVITKDRVRVSGIYPPPVHGPLVTKNFGPMAGQSVVITCAPTKTPEQIAGDVRRRFLPRYEALYRELAEARARYICRLEQEQRALEALASASGGDLNRVTVHLKHRGYHLPSGSIKVSMLEGITTAEFDLRGVPMAVAVRIAFELANARGGG